MKESRKEKYIYNKLISMCGLYCNEITTTPESKI